jgi:hypothetical protein
MDFTRVAADGVGRRIAAIPITLPAGSIVLDADGAQSTLATDVVGFVQITGIGDAEGRVVTVRGESGSTQLAVGGGEIALLASIDKTLSYIHTFLQLIAQK